MSILTRVRPSMTEIDLIRTVLREEADAVAHLAYSAGDEFVAACDLIEACTNKDGTVIITGLGKSGLVGAKIAATFSSLGIPSHTVHPTEAAHGDLGRFRPCDVVICLSHSGETGEVVALASTVKQDGLPIIAITGGDGKEASSLEKIADVTIHLCIHAEAAGFVAPTASTTATMAAGDAIALAVARRRNFTHDDFLKRHPGGSLGGMLRPVGELLRFRVGKNLPLVSPGTPVREAVSLGEAGGRRPGALLVVGEQGELAGIFTDGDLRRLVLKDSNGLDRPIGEVMTVSPRTLPQNATAAEASQLFSMHRNDEIPVVDDDGKPVGLLDVQDLIALRLVRD